MTGESQPEKTTPTTPQSAPTAPDTAPATPDDSPREFDVVVFGATGFVGELTARYLAEHAPAGTRIALAGRSETKLADTRSEERRVG